MPRNIEHRAAFESHGETYVRVLAQKDDEIGRNAAAWLAEQQALHDDAAASKRDAREDETLTIAKEANNIARSASFAATAAASAATDANNIARSNRLIAIAAAAIAIASAIVQIIWR